MTIAKTFTVEACIEDSYELVLATTNEEEVKGLSPADYDTDILLVKTWAGGKEIQSHSVETSKNF